MLRVCIRAVLINLLFLRIYPLNPSPENDDVAAILARRATLLKSLGFSNGSNDKSQGWDSPRHGQRHKGANVCPRALEGRQHLSWQGSDFVPTRVDCRKELFDPGFLHDPRLRKLQVRQPLPVQAVIQQST